ncbi:VOC family protein [Consotaella aegiceratis]|uniref:VOC family protein n=1 Tax=Consotaella aegiceratis TaxID=3097961 RepID=UPI002F3E47BA
MLDHVGFAVKDFARARAFYEAALAPLGMTVVMDGDEAGGFAGFGKDGKPWFWIGNGPMPATAVHVAFSAPDRAAVDAFHAAALEAGGRDNGAPGLRPHYHSNYYGAFVFDPDGNNIEAVCHKPE